MREHSRYISKKYCTISHHSPGYTSRCWTLTKEKKGLCFFFLKFAFTHFNISFFEHVEFFVLQQNIPTPRLQRLWAWSQFVHLLGVPALFLCFCTVLNVSFSPSVGLFSWFFLVILIDFFSVSERIETLESHFVAEPVLFHGFHHIRLVVPQSLDCVEHIHNVLLLNHLSDATHCAESATSSSTS